ncbi:hypothetical protein [Bacillus sp. UMB0893]|uniref:hypothetical protein n=1 Tax=Bacillus sp. UMB0893 TaxID=2066053 RepID=UPI000C76F2EB|nr:hypothetical protein [Bacillus sp. UMB0893]PLR69104.1 hypothetical protein CYJ36_01190 [Bacillus sp. UMB0893]
MKQKKEKSRNNKTNKTHLPLKTFYAIVKRGKTERVFTYKSSSRLKAKKHLEEVTNKHDYEITYTGVLG